MIKYSTVSLAFLQNGRPTQAGLSAFENQELEETAKLYLLLRGLNPRYLSPAQVNDLADTFGLTPPDDQ